MLIVLIVLIVLSVPSVPSVPSVLSVLSVLIVPSVLIVLAGHGYVEPVSSRRRSSNSAGEISPRASRSSRIAFAAAPGPAPVAAPASVDSGRRTAQTMIATSPPQNSAIMSVIQIHPHEPAFHIMATSCARSALRSIGTTILAPAGPDVTGRRSPRWGGFLPYPRRPHPRYGPRMYGYAERKDELRARLRKIEGQVRGLDRMVAQDSYCLDILTQVNSAVGALRALGVELLDDHVRHCVRESIEQGNADAKVEELVVAVARFAGR